MGPGEGLKRGSKILAKYEPWHDGKTGLRDDQCFYWLGPQSVPPKVTAIVLTKAILNLRKFLCLAMSLYSPFYFYAKPDVVEM